MGSADCITGTSGVAAFLGGELPYHALKDPLILFAHLLTTIVKRMGSGGAKAAVAGRYPDSTESGLIF